MQNRYAGDVGDFLELGLIRSVSRPQAAGGSGLVVGVNGPSASSGGCS